MEFKDEVVIVGAGPTGLLAAVLLARSGVRIRLYDKNPEQAHESRALGVQAGALSRAPRWLHRVAQRSARPGSPGGVFAHDHLF
jgi:2-polyprenyl-6-methoxyphenol hydroxylase-like FAD-dependent oxidoreductase